jgi:hypothetical protein
MVQKVLYGMLILVPITLALYLMDIGGHSLIFVLSALSLIPLAGVLGTATEETAIYTGPKACSTPRSAIWPSSSSRLRPSVRGSKASCAPASRDRSLAIS